MIIYTLIFLLIDIISKLIISNLLELNSSIVIIRNFFSITYVHNTGAAWSILSGRRLLLLIVTSILLLFIINYIRCHMPSKKIDIIGDSMVLGGAIGNFIDRLFLGYVKDFLDFNLFGYNYPIFNLADSFIFIGLILLIYSSWRNKKWR